MCWPQLLKRLTGAGAIGLAASSALAQFGGFAARIDVPLLDPTENPTDIVLVDLDNDGDLDVAMTIFTPATFDQVAIFRNDGAGASWTQLVSPSVGSDPLAIDAADVDNDGDQDLIVSNRGTNDVSVLRNQGAGTFLPEVIVPTGPSPHGVSAGEMTNDGLMDFVVTSFDDSTVSVFFGDGTGVNWTLGTTMTTHNGGGTGGLAPRDVKAVDLNHNGLLDIVTANSGSGTCTILYAVPGAPGFWFWGDFALFVTVQSGPLAIEVGDLDNDGDEDLAIAHAFPSNSVSTRMSNFDTGVAFPAFSGGTNQVIGTDYIADLKLGDLESGGAAPRADGDLDILAVEANRALLHARLNNGSGSFSGAGTFDAFNSPACLDTGDLDGDGDLDVVTGLFSASSFGVFLNASTVVGGPPPIVSFLNVTDQSCVCGSVTIQGTAASAGGPFGSYTLEYRRLGDPTFSIVAADTVEVINGTLGVWNTLSLQQGYYVLRLTAFNAGDISSTVEVVVYLSQFFDTLTAHAASGLTGQATIVGGTSCIFGTVYNNACGNTHFVDFRPFGSGSFTPVDPLNPVYFGNRINEILAEWNTIIIPDGLYELRVVAEENCGNGASITFPITVDNTPPTAVITSPANCSDADPFSPVVITGTATDANLSAWSLSYTGGGNHQWIPIASGTGAVVNGVLANWDVSGLDPCSYTIRLRVSDQTVVNCNTGRFTDYFVSLNIGCRADLAVPFGSLDFSDVLAFLTSFGAGCGP